jgi:hypothetical protein
MAVHRQAQQTSELVEWLKVAGGLTAIAAAFMISCKTAGSGYRHDDENYARRRERRRLREEAHRRRHRKHAQ